MKLLMWCHKLFGEEVRCIAGIKPSVLATQVRSPCSQWQGRTTGFTVDCLFHLFMLLCNYSHLYSPQSLPPPQSLGLIVCAQTGRLF